MKASIVLGMMMFLVQLIEIVFLISFFVYRDSEDLSDPDCTGYGGGPLVCARKDDSSR